MALQNLTDIFISNLPSTMCFLTEVTELLL